MANSLLSPGIQVSVIDESNYATNSAGTIPFILMATAQDKTNTSGSMATGTAKANANTVYNVGDQRSLANLFGLPTFPSDASGNRIYGSELAEYGLYAAHNILGTISSAYVMRADIDLNELKENEARPTSPATAGTLWLDTATTEWGIFEWDKTTQSFIRKIASFIYTANHMDGSIPAASYGSIGDYAVVGYEHAHNPTYFKNSMNQWVLVGSTAWQGSAFPTVTGSHANVNNISPGDAVSINGVAITVSGTSASGFVGDIGSSVTGVSAAVDPITGLFSLYADSTAMSNGTDADGKIHIVNVGGGTILSRLGITGGYYACPVLQYGKHSNVPQWKTGNSVPRPSGSVWVKTTSYNHGAKLSVHRRNGVSDSWDLVANSLYANDYDANFNLDPTRGGFGISRGTLYTQYDIAGDGTLSYSIFTRLQSGATTAVGTAANARPYATGTFTIQASQIGSNTLTSPVTITVPNSPNNTVAGVAAAISSANIANLQASVTTTGNFSITHSAGGVIVLNNTSSGHNPLTDLGITTDISTVRSGAAGLIVSNWVLPTAPAIIEQPTEPTTIPADGSLWFYSGVLEADIMINENNVWRGYRHVEVDARGFNLTLTDINGPIISYSKPTTQSTGAMLQYGDLWVDTSDFDSYPAIWRWESLNGTDQWISIDVTDATTENGVVFGDARWDGDGMADVLMDDLPMISALLLNDNIDLDAPNADLYPNGCLLFNTRRSSNNVKKYVKNYFTSQSFPLNQLPTVSSTWQSYSGKSYNNVPFFGRKAQRNVIVSALASAINNSADLTEEGKNFNLLVCPGYPELLVDLKALNDNRKNTGFVLGEVPMGLSTDQTSVERYATDASGTGTTGEFGITINDPYTAVFYPGGAAVNAPDGIGSVIVPMSAAILKTVVLSDQNSEIWFAPAGNTRGTVDVLSIGYVDRMNNNAFIKTGTPQGVRDILYPNKLNPVIYLPQVGYVNYGNHTRQANNTALDRINVARLVTYIRSQLEQIVRPLIFEPNDTITREIAKTVCSQLLSNIATRRGLYDYLVVCDTTNNTNSTIDRNELHIDIAIEPVKSIEFIYIPIRLKATGQIASGNITPSAKLG